MLASNGLYFNHPKSKSVFSSVSLIHEIFFVLVVIEFSISNFTPIKS